jgi:hypothetical protein
VNPLEIHNAAYSRRHFFRKSGTGLGMALSQRKRNPQK